MKRKIYSILTERTLALQAALALTLWASSSFQALAQDDVYVLGGGGGHAAGVYTYNTIYLPPLVSPNYDHGNGAKDKLLNPGLIWMVTAGQGGFNGSSTTQGGGGGGSTFFLGTPTSGLVYPGDPTSATNTYNGATGTAGGAAGQDWSSTTPWTISTPSTPPAAPWVINQPGAVASSSAAGGDGGSVDAEYTGVLTAGNVRVAPGGEGQGFLSSGSLTPDEGGKGGDATLTIKGALTANVVTVNQGNTYAYNNTTILAGGVGNAMVSPDEWGAASFTVDSVLKIRDRLFISSQQAAGAATVNVQVNTLDVTDNTITSNINIEIYNVADKATGGSQSIRLDTIIMGNGNQLTIKPQGAGGSASVGSSYYYETKKWIINGSAQIDNYQTHIDFTGDTLLFIPSGLTDGSNFLTAHFANGTPPATGIIDFDNNTTILVDISKSSPKTMVSGDKITLIQADQGFVGNPLLTPTITAKNGKYWLIDVDTTYKWLVEVEHGTVPGLANSDKLMATLFGNLFIIDLTPKDPTFPDVTYDKPPVGQVFDVENNLGGNVPITSVEVTFDNGYFELIGDVPQNVHPGDVGHFTVAPREDLPAGTYTDVMRVTICSADECVTYTIELQFTSRLFEIPDLTRHVIIKATDGVSIATDEVSAPSVGIGAYVLSRTDFTFTIVANKETYSLDDATFRVLKSIDLTESDITKTVERLADGSVRVTVHNVNTNITVEVSGITFTANEQIDGLKIYTYDGSLHIAAPEALTVYIYNVQGSLVKTLTVAAGATTVPLPSGTYIVKTVPGASTHTVINK